MSDHDDDIKGLLGYLSLAADHSFTTIPSNIAAHYYSALDALVVERDALKQRVAELEVLSKPVYISHGQRVESIDLRERLIESALRGMGCKWMMTQSEAGVIGRQAVWIVDAAIAAMRKGETDGK